MSRLTDALAGMGLSEDLDPDDLITDAFIVAKVINNETGREAALIANTNGMGSITQLGLLAFANHTLDSGWDSEGDDE